MYGVNLKGSLPRKILSNLKSDIHCLNKYGLIQIILHHRRIMLVRCPITVKLCLGLGYKVVWYARVTGKICRRQIQLCCSKVRK